MESLSDLFSVQYFSLSLIFNDLDLGIVNWILKFADDTKIFRKISNILFKHFTVHIEHGIKTAIANECELIARSGTCHLRPAKS